MKKKISIIIFIVTFIIAALVSRTIYINIEKDDILSEEDTNFYKDYKMISDNDVEIYLYGDKIEETKYLELNYLNDLGTLNITKQYSVLVINDFSNECEISSTNYNKIKELINNSNLFLIYYGKQKLNDLYNLGFTTTKPLENSGGIISGPNYIDGMLEYTDSFVTDKYYTEEAIARLTARHYLKSFLSD